MKKAELETAIATKGNEIRALKQHNPEQKDISTYVTELLSLKEQYKTLTGEPFPSQPSTSKSTKSKNQLKKEKKLAEGSKKSKSKPKAKKPSKVSETARVSYEPSVRSDGDRLLRQCQFSHKAKLGMSSQSVTPWDVEADENGVDYEKLIKNFGCSKIDAALIERIEKLTGQRAHRYLRRGYFFSHRDLKEILDVYEKGEKFYLYTGRGPSSGSLHFGHLIPFTFTAYLQKVFDVPLVIQLTNDEKYLFKDQTLEESCSMMWENAKDIIACGFDIKKTFMFADTDYIHEMYPNILKVQKCVTYNQVRGIFGFTGQDNIGKSAFPAVQAVPSFSNTFPVPLKNMENMQCLIPQAIDQDPYFRMTRDVAPRLGYKKPALIHSKFFPALQGSSSKMSASSTSSTVFVSDTPEEITNKIKKYAFSGGGETKADHEKYGANLSVDIPYQYLTFMLEDDAELEHIAKEYSEGRMMSGEVKNRLIDAMVEFCQNFQQRRNAITDEEVREYMRVRPLEF